LQGAIADEHEAEFVGDGEEIEQEPQFVDTLPEPRRVVSLQELEHVAAQVTHQPAVSQTREDLGWVLACMGIVVYRLLDFLVSDKFQRYQSLFECIGVFFGDFYN
jgi:hypothetical protein